MSTRQSGKRQTSGSCRIYKIYCREILTLSRKHSRHRYHRHLVLICCCIAFLLITSLRHIKLRGAGEDVVEDIAPVQGGEDYDANLTEEETAILSRSFRSADFDSDARLTETELSMAISRETKQHITVTTVRPHLSSNCLFHRKP